METISNRPMIDYLCFLQDIYNRLKIKKNLSEEEIELLKDVEIEINSILTNNYKLL